MAVLLQGTPFTNILFSFSSSMVLSTHFLAENNKCECTCEVLLQEILKAEEHHFTELGAFLASAFKVGVDFADIWRILFVVCDLKDKKQTEVTTRESPKNRLTESVI